MIHEPRVQELPRTQVMPAVEYASPPGDYAARPSLVAWGALIAGVVAAMAVQMLLTVLGLAVGMSIPGTTGTAEGMTIGAGIWWAVSGIIALFVGGWVAGWLSLGRRAYPTREHQYQGMLYGFLTWATVTALSIVLVAGLGAPIAGGAMAGVMQDTGLRPQQPAAQTQQPIAGAPVGDIRPADEETRRELAAASWGAFIALLLGAGAAAFGGYTAVSARREDTGALGKRTTTTTTGRTST
jgi:hypothetical protein